MKQQINLYVGELKPKKERFPLALLLYVWGATIAVIIISSLFISNQLTDAEAELAKLQTANQQLNAQVVALTEQLQQRQPSVQLTQRSEQLNAEVKIKTALLAELGQRAPMKSKGFSELMADLATYHDDDIWLNGIQADEAHLSLSGFTLNSEAVPRWVQGFQRGQRLRQAGFASLTMSRDEQHRLMFTLSSFAGGEHE